MLFDGFSREIRCETPRPDVAFRRGDRLYEAIDPCTLIY